MKTVLIDNSLCTFPLVDNVNPNYIYSYICALRDTGVKYIELDFRCLMKLHQLPEGVGYVFRLVDPMFLQLTGYFDFNYILLTYTDIMKGIKTDVPIMFETEYIPKNMGKTIRLVRKSVDGDISALRIRSDFEYDTPENVANKYRSICAEVPPLAVDVCPMNSHKTALDYALKFTAANVDSLTLTSGLPTKYCSLEEYFFSLLTLFNSLPSEFSIRGLGKAAIYRSHIFQSAEDSLSKVLDMLDKDVQGFKNVDTGEDVSVRVRLKETEYLNKKFVSAFEKMAQYESMPNDLFEEVDKAIKHFDKGLYSDKVLNSTNGGLLN